MSVWNEERMIECALDSLCGCNHFIIADGAYQDYPGAEHHLSTDDTLDKALELRPTAHTIEPDTYWPDQAAKRTAMLRRADDLANEGDWLIVIDADEELIGLNSIRYFLERIEDDQVARKHVGWLDICIRRGPNRIYTGHRVFRWLPGLHYDGSHHVLLTADGRDHAPINNRVELKTEYRSAWLHWQTARIEHYKDKRDKGRLNTQGEYYFNRKEHQRT